MTTILKAANVEDGNIAVQMLRVDTYIDIADKHYVVVSTVTTQTITSTLGNPAFTTIARLQPTDDEGEHLDEPIIEVNLGNITYTVV